MANHLRVVNTLCTATFDLKRNSLDLDRLAAMMNDTVRTAKFPGLQCRFRFPNCICVVTLFASGRMNIAGCTEASLATDAVRHVYREIEVIYPHSPFRSASPVATLQNRVFATHIPFLPREKELDLREILLQNSKQAVYEPENFPGLHFRDQSGIMFVIFSSGKINILAANRQLSVVKRAYHRILGIIRAVITF